MSKAEMAGRTGLESSQRGHRLLFLYINNHNPLEIPFLFDYFTNRIRYVYPLILPYRLIIPTARENILSHTDTRTDRFIRRCKDHPVIAFIFVIISLIIGIGACTDAVEKMWKFYDDHIKAAPTTFEAQKMNQPSPLPVTPVVSITATVKKSEESKQRVVKATSKALEKVRQQVKVYDLLSDAEQHLESYRLTTPKGSNALEKYKEVLKLDPESKEAKEGLDKIVIAYTHLIDRDIEKGHYKQAEQYILKARAIAPQSAELTSRTVKLTKAKEANSVSGIRAAGNNSSTGILTVSTTIIPPSKQSHRTDKIQYSSKAKVGDISKCVSEAAIRSALTLARATHNSQKQYAAYKKTVNSALCQPFFPLALTAAGEIYQNGLKDEALFRIVEKALSLGDYNHALIAATRMYFNGTKDNALSSIVNHAISAREYTFATSAAKQMYYDANQDNARAAILNAVTNQ